MSHGGSRSLAQWRREARLWGSVALIAGLAIVDQTTMRQLSAASLIVMGIWLLYRYPRRVSAEVDRASRVNAAARLVLLACLALAAIAFAISRTGEQRARIAELCPGTDAVMGDWRLSFARVTPVAGPGFTAIEADFSASHRESAPIGLKPKLRSLFLSAKADDEVTRVALPSGDLSLQLAGFDERSGCVSFAATWQPLAGLARAARWLAVLGASIMALVALESLRWRTAARRRIAMRREERPLPGRLAIPEMKALRDTRGRWLVSSLVLAIGIATWLAIGLPGFSAGPAIAPVAGGVNGAALVKARQSLLEGPANTNRWIVIADALARRGQFANASELLLGAVEADPGDPEGWLALGDALYAHAGGQLTPAAVLAYDRADRAALARGAALPPAGLVMEASGREELAQLWWRRLLARPDGSAAVRASVQARLNYSAP